MSAHPVSIWRHETLAPANTMREIAVAVAASHGCSVAELRGQSRIRIIARPRQEAMWLCRQVRLADGKHRYSLPLIGHFFGGRDHTTVLHAVRVHQARMCGESVD
jgi:chromosomal replication initiator protein